MIIIILFVLLYLFISIILALVGKNKKIGFAKGLMISVFLTPLTGLLFVSMSERKEVITLTRFHCKECGLEYTEPHIYCPACLKENKKNPLFPVRMKSI